MAAAGSRSAFIALLCAGCTSVAPDLRTFENTRWRVVAVNGQATPPAGDYQIRFERGEIGGRLGCNQFGGRSTLAGETIVVRDMASTLMGCPEPAASFESAGLRVLGAPVRWSWAAGRKLTLGNAAGSLQLERLP